MMSSSSPGVRLPALTALTDAQRRAVMCQEQDVRVSGGAGTGKTAVLLRRVEHVISNASGEPERTVVLTGTPAAARFLRGQIEQMLPQRGGRIHVDTVSATCAQILRHHGGRMDLEAFSVYGDPASRQVVERVMDDRGYSTDAEAIRGVWKEIARTKCRRRSPGAVTDPLFCEREVLEDVYPAYQNALQRARALDRQDLTLRTARLFDEDDALRSQYRTHWRHVHVDDFQNWVPAEGAVLKHLVGPSASLFVTCDQSQCVRATYGAIPVRMEALWDDRPDPKQIDLSQSFRPPRLIKSLADSLVGEGEAPSPEGEEMLAADEDGPAVLLEAPSAEKEAQAIARRIEWLCGTDGFSYGDIAVLTRREAEQEYLGRVLAAEGIPLDIQSGAGRPESIHDLMAYFQVADNPHDDLRLLRILNRPSRGIGPKTKTRLRAHAQETDASVWEALDHADEVEGLTSGPRRSVQDFREMMEPFVEAARKEPPSAWGRDLLAENGFLQSVTRGNTREHLDRKARVEAFLNRLEGTENRQHALSSLLHRAWLEGSERPPSDEVLLSTIHAARSVEAPVLFVASLEEGLFPPEGTTDRDALLAEERRLMYVALVRAQERLFLSWARSRTRGTSEEPSVRSRFLDELDDTLLRGEQAGQLSADLSSGDVPEQYLDLNPHYYRDNLRANQTNARATPSPTAEDANRIEAGLRVEHEKMGEGTVVETEGEGQKRVAIVDFDGRGEKKIQLRYAPLTVLGEVPEE